MRRRRGDIVVFRCPVFTEAVRLERFTVALIADGLIRYWRHG